MGKATVLIITEPKTDPFKKFSEFKYFSSKLASTILQAQDV